MESSVAQKESHKDVHIARKITTILKIDYHKFVTHYLNNSFPLINYENYEKNYSNYEMHCWISLH